MQPPKIKTRWSLRIKYARVRGEAKSEAKGKANIIIKLFIRKF